MIISAPAALIYSSASIAGNTHLPAQSSQSSFISYLERQSHRPAPSRQQAGARLRYTRLDKAMLSTSKASADRTRHSPGSRETFLEGDGVSSNEAPISLAAPQQTSAPSASLTLDPSYDRAEAVFSKTYAGIHGCTQEQAREIILQADRILYDSWRQIKTLADIKWLQSPVGEPLSAHDLAHAATSFTSRLLASLEVSDSTAAGLALHYLTTPARIVMEDAVLSDMYWGVLQRSVRWISADKVRAHNLTDTQIIQTVLRYRHPNIPTRTAFAKRLQHEHDVFIDEAILIAFKVHSRSRIIPQGTLMEYVRMHHINALVDEYQDRAIGLHLLPSAPMAPEYTKFWYDGTLIQNAHNKNLQQIVDALFLDPPHSAEPVITQRLIDNAGSERLLIGQPRGWIGPAQRKALLHAMHGNGSDPVPYTQRPDTVRIEDVWLTKEELYAIVEKEMHSLMLDTHYPIGTPQHAIATTVLRTGPLHGIDFQAFDEPVALQATFNRIEKAWHDDPHFSISPHLSAAHYLAQTAGVLFLNTALPLTRVEQIRHQVTDRFTPGLKRLGGKPMLERLCQGLDETIDAILDREAPSLPLSDEQRLSACLLIFNGIKKQVDLLKNASETISYSSTNDLIRRLHDYLHQRMLAYAPLPVYDETFLVKHILRTGLSMSDDDLRKRTEMEIRTAPGNSFLRFYGKPQEEFLLRSQLPSIRTMHYNGKQIDTISTLAEAKIRTASKLQQHPIIIAKSKEALLQAGVPHTAENVAAVGNSMVENIMDVQKTLSAMDFHDMLKQFTLAGSPMATSIINILNSGDPRQILGLFPFIIPLYDIEEGIRLHDRQRATDGIIHFGEDAILTLLGGGAEKILAKQLARDAEAMLMAGTRMSPIERTGVNTVRAMAMLTPEVSPKNLAQRRVIVNPDAYDVHTSPKAIEGVTTVSAGSDRQVPETLFLFEEGRSLTAVKSANGYTQTNQRGQPVLNAPPIFRDEESGAHYRLRQELGVPQGVSGISAEELSNRETVMGVKEYWDSIMAIPKIRARRAFPLEVIRKLFVKGDHSLSAEFENFWVTAYKRSDTAAAMLNAAYNKAICKGIECIVEFDAPEARAYKDRICFMPECELAKQHYASPDGATAFQRNRMWVHESVHRLTGLGDPIEDAALDHRGGTVFLTDRILSEFGDYPPLPPRTSYRLLDIAEPRASDNEPRSKWRKALRINNDRMIAENRYLDEILDQGRDYPASMQVMGKPIANRLTVRQAKLTAGYIRTLGKLGTGNEEQLLAMVSDSFTSSTGITNKSVLRNLIHKSPTFRILTAGWLTKFRHTAINFNWRNFDTTVTMLGHRSLYASLISSDESHIWLNSQTLYYFSDIGTRNLSAMRKYVGVLIDLFVGGMTPNSYYVKPEDLRHDRGLGVLLENYVMQEIGDLSPPRICAALSDDPDAYLRDQTTVTRAAFSEDGYLHKTHNPTREGDPSNTDSNGNDLMCSLLSCISDTEFRS
jgi:hypothetical protein